MNSKKLGVWLGQTEAHQALGITISAFQQRKLKLLDNGLIHQKKKYFVPLDEMTPLKKSQYEDVAGYSDIQDQTINELVQAVDFTGEKQELDIQQARRRKILKETEYLSQKIIAKKEQIFSEWSQKFFGVFAKSFTKFKNSLIDLRLNPDQLKLLNENLDFALKSMQLSLSDIYSNFMQDQQEQIQ